MKKKRLTPDTEETSHEFNKRKPHFDSLEKEAHYTLEKSLGKTDIKLHSIAKRVKSLDSFLDKINRYQIEKPFEQIDDVVGLRVICLFLSDIERIGDIIRKNFTVIRDDNKIDNSKLASFGYLSVHFIVKLGEGYKGTRYEDIVDIPFEIQVRTIAMDAWANISHYLDYKTDQDIPKELKKDFYALSGMFYVADKHFQLFFEQRERKQEKLVEEFEESTKENTYNQPLDLDSLTAYLQTKFPGRKIAPSEYISKNLAVLQKVGYETIEQINQIVDKGLKAALDYEKDSNTDWSNMGLLVTIFQMCDSRFHFSFWAHTYPATSSKKFIKESAQRMVNIHEQQYAKYTKVLKQ